MKKALIVDDEAPSREILTNLIRKYRFPVEVLGYASNGETALEMITELRPDIVFLDIRMPGLNGIDMLEILKENCEKTQTALPKIVFITAYDQFEYARRALVLGARDYLLKPVDYRQFTETMQRILGYNYTDNPAFNELLGYIDENYYMNLSLDDYAKHVHLSPGHITRLFKKYLNTGFKAWLNGVRVHKAMELLENTDDSIKTISDKVGYNNLNYFYRQFAAITGKTPKNYRS